MDLPLTWLLKFLKEKDEPLSFDGLSFFKEKRFCFTLAKLFNCVWAQTRHATVRGPVPPSAVQLFESMLKRWSHFFPGKRWDHALNNWSLTGTSRRFKKSRRCPWGWWLLWFWLHLFAGSISSKRSCEVCGSYGRIPAPTKVGTWGTQMVNHKQRLKSMSPKLCRRSHMRVSHGITHGKLQNLHAWFSTKVLGAFPLKFWFWVRELAGGPHGCGQSRGWLRGSWNITNRLTNHP